MKTADYIAIAAILVLIAVTLLISGKWKLLIKKPDMKGSFKEPVLSAKEAIAVSDARKAIQTKKEAEQSDKVLCEFCDSYVDIDDNETCPNCGASLKEAIEAAAEKKAIIELEMLKIQGEMEKSRMEAERKNKILDLTTAAAVSLFAPITGASMLNSARKRHKK